MGLTRDKFKKEYQDLLDRMAATQSNKDSDYAGEDKPLANLRLSEMAGIDPWVGVAIRMGDKYSRIMNFVRQGSLKVKDESVEDTLVDLAVYSLLCVILYREQAGKYDRPIEDLSHAIDLDEGEES